MSQIGTGLIECHKCMWRATRIAHYYWSSTWWWREVPAPSCDHHGGPPYEGLPQAAAARAWNAENGWAGDVPS